MINLLLHLGIKLSLVAHYLLVPDTRHNLNVMAKQYLHYTPLPIEALIGSKSKAPRSMQTVDIVLVKEYAGEDADITLQVYQKLVPEIAAQGLEKMLYEVELPLIKVLAAMEHAGVKIDTGVLATLSENMAQESQVLAQEIHILAGEIFNIASPKQLGTSTKNEANQKKHRQAAEMAFGNCTWPTHEHFYGVAASLCPEPLVRETPAAPEPHHPVCHHTPALSAQVVAPCLVYRAYHQRSPR